MAERRFFLTRMLFLFFMVCFLSCATTEELNREALIEKCIAQLTAKKASKLTKADLETCQSKVVPLVEESNLDGGLSQAEVVGVFKTTLNPMRTCYDERLNSQVPLPSKYP